MLRDSWLVFVNEMTHRKRQALWLVVGLMQPMLYLYLYGPLVTQMMSAVMNEKTWEIYVPALLLQVSLTQSFYVGLNLLAEHKLGIVDRFRVTPMSRIALVAGKIGAITVTTVPLCLAVVLMCKASFNFTAGTVDIAVCVLSSVIVAVAIAAFSYGLAFRIKDEAILGTLLNALLLPLMLLSGAFLPITEAAPTWLYQLSRINPLTYVMDADRAILRGDYANHDVFVGGIVLFVMTGCLLAWAVRAFARDGE